LQLARAAPAAVRPINLSISRREIFFISKSPLSVVQFVVIRTVLFFLQKN
jgi:hypothetical protein